MYYHRADSLPGTASSRHTKERSIRESALQATQFPPQLI